MSVEFVTELPAGVPQRRRTRWDGVVDQLVANPGQWARVKSVSASETVTIGRRVSELTASLKRVVENRPEAGLEFEVRQIDGETAEGFLQSNPKTVGEE